MEYGKDWRVKIGDGADPEVFTAIGGETQFDWKRQSDTIDLSSKDDGIYKSQSYGQQTITISVQGKVKLPDTSLEAAFTASKTSPPQKNIEITDGAGNVKFAGQVGIGNFSMSAPDNGPCTYSFDMSNIGAPTTDDLGATS